MNQNSLWPVLAAFCVTLAAVYLCDLWLANRSHVSPTFKRKPNELALNGLRGFVIFCVVIHHATIFYGYLRTGVWQTSFSYLQVHLGINKVFVLFMLSGFLFTTKLINAKFSSKPFNWLAFYIARTLRLVPMYLVFLAGSLCIVFVATHFTLHESFNALIKQIAQWLSFTLLGSPAINGFDMTPIAGITWSLPYEWFFYGLLPLVAYAIRPIPKWPYVTLAIACAICLYLWQPLWDFMTAFVFGIAMAALVRNPRISRFSNQLIGTLFAIMCIVVAAIAFPNGREIGSRIFIFMAVCVIAAGNDIFKLFKLRVFQSLGERSYSIYLLHSLVFYIAFEFVLSHQYAAALNAAGHWTVISVSFAIIIPICYVTYHFIERPIQQFAPAIEQWLESKFLNQAKADIFRA